MMYVRSITHTVSIFYIVVTMIATVCFQSHSFYSHDDYPPIMIIMIMIMIVIVIVIVIKYFNTHKVQSFNTKLRMSIV